MAVGDESQADMVEPIQEADSSDGETGKQANPDAHST